MPAKEPAQLLERHSSAGTAPTAMGPDTRWARMGQEVQDPDRAAAEMVVTDQTQRWKQVAQAGSWAGTQWGRTGDEDGSGREW